MPRQKTPQTGFYPIHIVARSNNHDWFRAPLDQCWEIFAETISETHKKFGFETHSFVLMSNHYHWLMSTPNEQLAEGMCFFQSTTSRKIARSTGRINRIYGARYKPTLIEKPEHFANAYRYIYQNPLRAKICKHVECYPWSTLRDKAIRTFDREDFGILIPKTEELDWLNSLPSEEVVAATRFALRRRVFRYPRTKCKHRRESE